MSYFKHHFLNFQTWLVIRDVLLTVQDFPVRKTNASTSFMIFNSFEGFLLLGSEEQQILVFTPLQCPTGIFPHSLQHSAHPHLREPGLYILKIMLRMMSKYNTHLKSLQQE